MPKKFDQDSTASNKLLRLFRILLVDDSRHYLSDLARTLNCSSQTVLRLMRDIEGEFKENLESDLEGGRRYYRLVSNKTEQLDIQAHEVRYLSICSDLSKKIVPAHIQKRLSSSIFYMALKLSAMDDLDNIAQAESFDIIKKGYIDYVPYYDTIRRIIVAMRTRALLKIHYRRSRTGDIKEVIYVPMRLLSMSNALYSVGYIYDMEKRFFTKDSTCFLVHRIVDSENMGILESAKKLPPVVLRGMGLPIDRPMRYKIEFNSQSAVDYIAERIWSDDQEITFCDDGRAVLEITSCNKKEVESFIHSFGPGVARLIGESEINSSDKHDDSSDCEVK